MEILPRPLKSAQLIAVLVLLSCASRSVWAQDLGSDVLGKTKAATVFVKAKEATGTGFLFLKVGGTAYLMTCEHVVHGSETVDVVFNSGTRNEHSYRATVGVSDSDRDLACLVLKEAADLPEPLTLLDKTTVTETQTVYVAGFPFGDQMSASSRNPEVSVTRISVSSVRRGDREEVVAVQLSGDVNPGNSGGPVVDQHGSVIGVVQSKIEATQMAFAIPPESLGDFLDRCLSGKGESTTGPPTSETSPPPKGPLPGRSPVANLLSKVESRLYYPQEHGMKDFTCSVTDNQVGPRKERVVVNTLVLYWKAPDKRAAEFVRGACAAAGERSYAETLKADLCDHICRGSFRGIGPTTRRCSAGFDIYDLIVAKDGELTTLTGTRKEGEGDERDPESLVLWIDSSYKVVKTKATLADGRTFTHSKIKYVEVREDAEKEPQLLFESSLVTQVAVDGQIPEGTFRYEYAQTKGIWLPSKVHVPVPAPGEMTFEFKFKVNLELSDALFDKLNAK